MKEKKKIIIGVDPGAQTGLCVMDLSGKVHGVETVSGEIPKTIAMIEFLVKSHGHDTTSAIIAVEIPRRIQYNRHSKMTHKNQIVVALKCGEVIGRAKAIAEFLDDMDFEVRRVIPVSGMTKKDSNYVKAVYGIYPSNEHARDAIAAAESTLQWIRAGRKS